MRKTATLGATVFSADEFAIPDELYLENKLHIKDYIICINLSLF